MDPKKLYYYIISGLAFFILMWGAIDLASAGIGLLGLRGSQPAPVISQESGDQSFDAYYQRKILSDRLWDSAARVIVSGLVFAYFRKNASKLDDNVS